MEFDEREFEKIVGSLETNAAPDPEHRAKLRQEVLAAFDRTWQGDARRGARGGWGVLVKWAAVTAAVLVVAVAAWRIAGGRFWAAPPHPFANVLQRIQEAASVSYDVRTEGQGLSQSEHVALAEPGSLRHEDEGGRTWIMDFTHGRGLRLSATDRAAYPVTDDDMPPRSELDSLAPLRQLGRQDGRFVGATTLEGQPANLFQADGPRQKITLWADPATDLPRRVEIVVVGLARDNKPAWTTTLSNFSWNVPMPAGLFRLDPPPGYAPRDWAAGDAAEADLRDSLWTCATLAAGVFPDTFDQASAASLSLQAGAKDPAAAASGSVREQKAAYRAISRGLRFATAMTQAGNKWHYGGVGVRLGDRSRLVCWWKRAGAAGYRAVMGDLTVREVTADELPAPATRPATPPAKDDPTPK
ncbi:MAG: DUF2092 domain-containing protein [Planctomycetota bacterium]|nr:DUF2092 domain-containing protein [Planctomycetota bacterium]